MGMPPSIDLSLIPAGPPPPGQVSNFVDAKSSSWAGRLAIYLTLPIMTIAVVLRAYVRLKKRQVGVDDWFLLVGAASAASFCGVAVAVLLPDIYGRHTWNVPVSAMHPWFFEYSITSGPLYNTSAMFTKISILAFYLRIFSVSPIARAFIWIGIIVITLGYMAITSTTLAYMIPRPGDGDWGSQPYLLRIAKCSGPINLTQGVFSVVSDFYVIAVPTVIVFRLQLPTHKKTGIACIFLISFASLGCSIAGTALRYGALGSLDLWLTVRFQALRVTELNIGIFCACTPVFFVLLKTWTERAESAFMYLRQRLTHPIEMDSPGVYPVPPPPHHLTQNIPSGTLTRLKSIFHRVGHGTKQSAGGSEGAAGASQMSQFPELQSIDYEYHAQIWRYTPRGSERSLIPDSRHGRGAERR
ncbi:hypothetical protein BJX99DRAFT_265145 [Aspergillus californicus]